MSKNTTNSRTIDRKRCRLSDKNHRLNARRSTKKKWALSRLLAPLARPIRSSFLNARGSLASSVVISDTFCHAPVFSLPPLVISDVAVVGSAPAAKIAALAVAVARAGAETASSSSCVGTPAPAVLGLAASAVGRAAPLPATLLVASVNLPARPSY